MQRTMLVLLGVSFLMVAAAMLCVDRASGRLAAAQNDDIVVKPVDDSMHHFMEYLYEPRYKSLRALLAKDPGDKSAWKVVKADALTLAEAANLLLARFPEEKQKEWQAHAVAVRDRGGNLYKAARKSDYPNARKHYEAMITRCNACHQDFADGKYQLKP